MLILSNAYLLIYHSFLQHNSLKLLHGRKSPKYNNFILRPNDVDENSGACLSTGAGGWTRAANINPHGSMNFKVVWQQIVFSSAISACLFAHD